MSKVAHYLQEHLVGEVVVAPDAREHFSTDGSIFKLTPQIVVYPRNENDVRKAARFTWQLAERGRVIPLTARGMGADQTGAALGAGIVLVFPAHMNRIVSLDPAKGDTVVQPGLNIGKLEQTLHTHGRFLPPYPASAEYSSIAGAIADNAVGERSVKYGTMLDYIKRLRVVLANGEVIEVRRLNKRELGKKMGVDSFEGELYRQLNGLIHDNRELIENMRRNVSYNTAGYNLPLVAQKDGSFDLIPLITGSQGTLGIITEAELRTIIFNPAATVVGGYFDNVDSLAASLYDLRGLKPSMLEMIDGNTLKLVMQINPNQLRDTFEHDPPAYTLLVAFDDNIRTQRRLAKKASKIIDKYGGRFEVTNEQSGVERLLKLREATISVLSAAQGATRAVPVLNDAIVPFEAYGDLLKQVVELGRRVGQNMPMWGLAGDGALHVQPMLDLSAVGDRQKLFKLVDEYANIVIGLHGSISATQGDGRLRGPFLKAQFGDEGYALLEKVKQIFDPYGTLNPGVKLGVTLEAVRPYVRQEYSMGHWYDYMPRL